MTEEVADGAVKAREKIGFRSGSASVLMFDLWIFSRKAEQRHQNVSCE